MVKLIIVDPTSGEPRDVAAVQAENTALRQRVAELQAQVDLATQALSASKVLQRALWRCSTVGWPLEVVQAANRWQEKLDQIVWIPAAE